jgi:hypothetical protein
MTNGTDHTILASLMLLVVDAVAFSSPLYAEDVTASSDGRETKKVTETKPPEPRFKLQGWIEGGITGNPDSPIDNHNFGQLFKDRANEPLLNQVSIVAERDLNSNATGFDWGFQVWLMYGSDARYTKSIGLLDLVADDRVELDFPEISASLHLPVLTSGGVDLKVGKYQDPMSAEGTDPRSNIFYSHSYISNFGIPGTNTGILLVQHLNKYLDIYAGINRGVNASINDNNHSAAFEGGIGFNLLDGNLMTTALTHIGPENPGNNHDYRYLNDITATWKATKNLTSITDLNLDYDHFANAYGYGLAQYFTYTINDWLTAGLRGELWRDEEGFYVAQSRANNDFTHILRGDPIAPDPSNFGGGKTTYFEITFGVTFYPPVPKPLAGLLIRPEVRYDRTLTNSRPFDFATKRDQWTIGCDAIIEF